MADIVAAVTQFTVPATTDAAYDVTDTNFGGGTPKAVLFSKGTGITNASVAGNLRFGFGAATGSTEQFCIEQFVADFQSSAYVERRGFSNQVIGHTSNTPSLAAAFDSFITNGVRLNFSLVDSNEYLVNALLLGGADLSAKAGTVALPGSSGGTVTENVGFEPDIVLFFALGTALDDTRSFWCVPSIGAALNDVGLTQWCLAWKETHSGATAAPQQALLTDRIAAQWTDHETELTAFGATGFTLTQRVAGAGTDEVGYLALKLDGGDAWVGVVDSPTSTGVASFDGPGFEPLLGMLFPNWLTATDTVISGANGGVLGCSMFDGSKEFCYSFSNEASADPMNTNTLPAASALNILNDAGSGGNFPALFDSFDSLGFNLNFFGANGTTRKWPAIALGAGSAGGVTEIIGAAALGFTAGTVTTKANMMQELTAASFGWSGQALTTAVDITETIGAAAFSWAGQALTTAIDVTETITAATFAWTAQAFTTAVDVTETVGAAAFNWSAKTLTAITGSAVTITAAAFAWTAQALTARVDAIETIGRASFRFTAQAMGFTGQAVSRFTKAVMGAVMRAVIRGSTDE